MESPPALPPLIAGHPVVHLARTGSTSDEVRARASRGELRAGAVVVADVQTAGHGTHGRAWITPPGRALAASVLLAPPHLPRLTRISVLGAVAACRALARLGRDDIAIKWPNDLLRDGRKCGGMLVEHADTPSGARLLVFGIGLNLRLLPGDLPPELRDRAGDTDLPPAARGPLLEALLQELDAALGELGTAADAERGREYCRRAWLPGRQVHLRTGAEDLHVRIEAVTPEGDLLLPGGRLVAGESAQLLSVDRD